MNPLNNALYQSNARHLYESLGFQIVGIIPEGFRDIGDAYHDICIYYHSL